MQHVRITQELDVTDFKDHVQRELHARLLKYGGGFFLRSGERRDHACVAEAGEGAHVVGIPFAVDSAFALGTGLLIEDWLARVRFLASGDLAFAVEVPDRLG